VPGHATRWSARGAELWRSEARARYGAITGLFTAVSLFWTWPLAARLTTAVPGAPGDVPNGIRFFWALHRQHLNPFTALRDYLINAPSGVPVNGAVYIANGLFQGSWWFGGQLVGWVAAYNIFDLFTLVTAAVAAFILFDRFGFGALPALFGAYVFAFNPNHIEKFYSAAPLAATGVLPLLLFVLFAKRNKPTGRRAAVVGLVILIAFYADSYLGLLALLVVSAFVVADLVVPTQGIRRLAVARSYYFGALVFVFGMIPVAWSWLSNAKTVDAFAATRATAQAGAFSTVQLYLLPGPRNPWFGGPMRYWLHSHLAWEGTMFFGYTTLALAVGGLVLAIVSWRSGTLGRDSRVYVLVAVGLILGGIWASLPPTIEIAGVHLPVAQEFLHRATTLFRIYARFGVVVGLGEIMLAVFFLAHLRNASAARIVAVVAIALVAVELYVPRPTPVSIPQDLTAISTLQIGASLSGVPVLLSVGDTPAYVRWLQGHPGGIVADYPRPENPDGRWEWKQAFYQTRHHHPLWQVTTTVAAAQDRFGVRRAASDLDSALTPLILAASKVRYVVVHEDQYRVHGGAVPRPDARCLRAVARFPASSVTIYRAPSRSTRGWASRGNGFYSIANAKLWPESAGYAWMADTGLVAVYWPKGETVVIHGTAVSLNEPRKLTILDSAKTEVGSSVIAATETTFNIPVRVHAGFNTFTFVTTPGSRPRGFGDARPVSVAMLPITVASAIGKNLAGPSPSDSCRG
jgi:hypothetical protein